MKIVAYLSLLRCRTHFARTNNWLMVYQNKQPVQGGYIPVQGGYIPQIFDFFLKKTKSA